MTIIKNILIISSSIYSIRKENIRISCWFSSLRVQFGMLPFSNLAIRGLEDIQYDG